MVNRLTVALATFLIVALTGASSVGQPAAGFPADQMAPRPAARDVTNTCLGCHAGDASDGAAVHLAEWKRSPHGLNNAGCEQCHGGDAKAVTAVLAHGPHYRSHEPESPTNHHNVQRTCGTCHTAEFAAFRTGSHFVIEQAGNVLAPRCITCHGETAADRVSPDSIEKQCAQCHAAGKNAAHPEYVAGVRLAVVEQQIVRTLSRELHLFAGKLPLGRSRSQLEADLTRADAACRTANAQAHGVAIANGGAMAAAHGQIFALARRVLSMSDGAGRQ